ncbi:MAG: chloride channel protein [Flavobacteriales bacterium]|nr:chloride channel protein [Flavobacteriales bacterium]
MLLIPTSGILLSVLFTQVLAQGKLGRGLPSVLKDEGEQGRDPNSHKLYSQVVTSILTMGTGGSAGLEAPIAVTGAALGQQHGALAESR